MPSKDKATTEFRSPPSACLLGLGLIILDLVVLSLTRRPLLLEYALRLGVAVAFLGLLVSRSDARWADFGLTGSRPKTGGWLIRVSVVVMALYAVTGVLVLWYLKATNTAIDPNNYPRDFVSVTQLKEYAWSAYIFAPVVEELLYRAIAVPAFLVLFARTRHVQGWAIFASGPLFYLLHIIYNPANYVGLHYNLAGWILAWSLLRQRSLWVPIVLHSLGNVLMGLDDAMLIWAPEFTMRLLGWD